MSALVRLLPQPLGGRPPEQFLRQVLRKRPQAAGGGPGQGPRASWPEDLASKACSRSCSTSTLAYSSATRRFATRVRMASFSSSSLLVSVQFSLFTADDSPTGRRSRGTRAGMRQRLGPAGTARRRRLSEGAAGGGRWLLRAHVHREAGWAHHRTSTRTGVFSGEARPPAGARANDLPRRFLVGFGQEQQRRLHPLADVVLAGQAELHEDRVDVLLDRPLGQDERLGDRGVALALRDLGEDLVLAG